MAKKKENEEIIDNSKIIDGTFEQVMHNSMLPYSEHVILDRALPRVEDGLKPVQRRIVPMEPSLQPYLSFERNA